MATKEELIAGLELTITQAKRTTALFAEGEWDWKRASGWTPKEAYSHLAAVAAMVPTFAQAMAAAGEDQDLLQGMDVDQMNAQAVGSMSSMTPELVMQAFESNYRKLIDFVKSAPDDQWNARRRLASEAVPVSDILGSAVMLHGLHHVYEAATRVGAPVP
jgi:hypothetical protein